MAAGQVSDITELVPFLIEPQFVVKVWGYCDLRPWYDYVVNAAPTSNVDPGCGGGEPIGEVWLSGDQCRVATGPHKGAKLKDMFQAAPRALLGSGAPSGESPLLIKVIFALEKLSVQVHPDDRLAQKYGEPRGKTECWYALAAEPGAQLALGLKPGVTLEQVRTGIADGSLEKSLNVLPVSAGDLVFVDAGTVHAIWPGSILLETQQNCDITYRMYDYGRPRPLHIEKSLEATRLETRAGKMQPRVLPDRTTLIDVEYFRVERIPMEKFRTSLTLPAPDEKPGGLSFLFAAAGSARIEGNGFETVNLPSRGIAAIPATAPEFAVENLGGLDLIRISPRWPAGSL